MKRNVQVVVLCEDRQHSAFVLRFLKGKGWGTRQIRIEMSASGAATKFVFDQFPKELYQHRRRKVAQILMVMIDGDGHSVHERVAELDRACLDQQCPIREAKESVAIFVPTWRIETWLAYLDGRTVDESRDDYPRLPRERECRRHVDALSDMCDRQQLRHPAPKSLVDACAEFRRLSIWFS